MSFDAKRLFELLPVIYRLRDAGQGGKLEALIGILAGQAGVVDHGTLEGWLASASAA